MIDSCKDEGEMNDPSFLENVQKTVFDLIDFDKGMQTCQGIDSEYKRRIAKIKQLKEK
jgi:hypothetical protein